MRCVTFTTFSSYLVVETWLFVAEGGGAWQVNIKNLIATVCADDLTVVFSVF